MNSPIISIQNLSFSYPASPNPVIEDICLEIREREWISMMGPTGAGKSTFSLCLNGLVPHMQNGKWEGGVFVHGKNTTESSIPYLSSKVGVIFQDFNTQLFSSQVKLEIAFGMENFCIPQDQMQKRVEELLEDFDLMKYANTHPEELSGGERQRLAIASVLALSPRILVLDEPTTDLDPLNKEKLLSIIQKRHQEGLTILWIDHETELAFESDRLLIMDQGKIAQDTSFREFFLNPALSSRYAIRQPDIPRLYNEKMGEKMPVNFRDIMDTARKDKRPLGWKLSKERQRAYWASRTHAPSDKILIQMEELEYTYPNRTKALKGISMDIRQGEFLAILGQNGSGKTTLAKHLNGLLKPTKGRVIVNGKDTKTQSIYELSKDVGYCFQNPDNQIFASTVLEEVSFGPKNYQFSPSRISRYVNEALEAVDLIGYEHQDPFILTKGERQRIAVASILSMKPDIMIFDEPTTGLDYAQTVRMMELMNRLNQAGCTIIIITHAMWVAARYARRCVVISEGKISIDGGTHEVFAREDLLKEASLVPPDIVKLSNALGVTTLTLEEFKFCSE